MKSGVVIIVLLLIAIVSPAQKQFEYFISFGTNGFISDNSRKIITPVGFKKDADPKIFIGGYNFGFCVIRKVKEKLDLRFEESLAKFAYWNETIQFKDQQNQNLGSYQSRSSDFISATNIHVNYLLGQKFRAGTGIGIQTLLVSVIRNPLGNFAGADARSSSFNRNYKSLMPVVPFEVSLRNPKTIFTLRYERALLNRYRSDLARTLNESYGVISFQVGLKIK